MFHSSAESTRGLNPADADTSGSCGGLVCEAMGVCLCETKERETERKREREIVCA